MNKLLTLTTGLLMLAAGSAMAQNQGNWNGTRHWQGHDWDPPATYHPAHPGPVYRHDAPRRPHMVYAPRKGATVRDYVYYPSARAYYAPWNHRWYTRHGSRWVVQQSAPINISLGNGINISLGADSPVTYDSYVVQHYSAY